MTLGKALQGNSSAVTYSEDEFSKSIVIYVAPILLAVGTIGSVLSLLVLCQKPMRQQTTMFYLAVLAVADVAVLYTGLLRLWLDNRMDFYIRLQSSLACKLHNFGVYLCLDTSVWITVAVSLDRCIYVSLPHKAKQWCTVKRARWVIVLIVVTMSLINCHFLWTYDKETTESPTIAGNSEYRCYADSGSETSKRFIESIWPWIDFCVYCLVPFIIISVTTFIIIRQLIRSDTIMAKHRHGSLTFKNGHAHPKIKQDIAACVTENGKEKQDTGHGNGVVRCHDNTAWVKTMSSSLKSNLQEKLHTTVENGDGKQSKREEFVNSLPRTSCPKTVIQLQHEVTPPTPNNCIIPVVEVLNEMTSEASTIELQENVLTNRRLPPLIGEQPEVKKAFEKSYSKATSSRKNLVLRKIIGKRNMQVIPFSPTSSNKFGVNSSPGDDKSKSHSQSQQVFSKQQIEMDVSDMNKSTISQVKNCSSIAVMARPNDENTDCRSKKVQNENCECSTIPDDTNYHKPAPDIPYYCKSPNGFKFQASSNVDQTIISGISECNNKIHFSVDFKNNISVILSKDALDHSCCQEVDKNIKGDESIIEFGTPSNYSKNIKICNVCLKSFPDATAGLNRCINKLQDDLKENYLGQAHSFKKSEKENNNPSTMPNFSCKPCLMNSQNEGCKNNVDGTFCDNDQISSPVSHKKNEISQNDKNKSKNFVDNKVKASQEHDIVGSDNPWHTTVETNFSHCNTNKKELTNDYPEHLHYQQREPYGQEHEAEINISENRKPNCLPSPYSISHTLISSSKHPPVTAKNNPIFDKPLTSKDKSQHAAPPTVTSNRLSDLSLTFKNDPKYDDLRKPATISNTRTTVVATATTTINSGMTQPKLSGKSTAKQNDKSTAADVTTKPKPKRQRAISTSSTTTISKLSPKGVYVSITLVTINIVFGILNAPIMVFVIGHTYWTRHASDAEMAKIRLGWTLVILLQYTNCVLHFFFYCLTGPRFRQALVNILTSLVKKIKSCF